MKYKVGDRVYYNGYKCCIETLRDDGNILYISGYIKRNYSLNKNSVKPIITLKAELA